MNCAQVSEGRGGAEQLRVRQINPTPSPRQYPNPSSRRRELSLQCAVKPRLETPISVFRIMQVGYTCHCEGGASGRRNIKMGINQIQLRILEATFRDIAVHGNCWPSCSRFVVLAPRGGIKSARPPTKIAPMPIFCPHPKEIFCFELPNLVRESRSPRQEKEERHAAVPQRVAL